MEKEAIISNIQRFSVDDGPGIRTTVFFKGCNLKCLWCHNPETISKNPQIQFIDNLCMTCHKCVAVCPTNAQIITPRAVDRTVCNLCGKCTEVCPNQALKIIGKRYMVSKILEEVKKDQAFYQTSGGGVTLSGGEPMLQIDTLPDLLKALKAIPFHIAIDTAGNVDFASFLKVIPYVDLFLYDIKCFDPKKHKLLTGVDNQLILENIRRLSEKGCRIQVRLPLIKDLNDNPDELIKIADYLATINIDSIQLLPYHNYGLGKYQAFGIENTSINFKTPSKENLEHMIWIFQSRNLLSEIG